MSTKLKIKIVTWNVHSLLPPVNLDLFNLFSEEGVLTDADVVAVGLQEVSFWINNYLSDMLIRNEQWTELVKNFLSKHDYVQLSCGWTSKPRLMGLILLIFVKRISLPSVVRVETKFVKTGFSGYSSHKGAVCARLTLKDDTHVTFINAHLSAGTVSLTYRIKEYYMIMTGLRFESSNVISNDYVFWFGDLNFRIENFTYDETMRLIESNYVDKLLEYDQLKRSMNTSKAFTEFQEGSINFKPTYKFVLGTSAYDSRREPAWCDRILYRLEEGHRDSERKLFCELLNYESILQYTNSDHKPVTATFFISVHDYVMDNFVTFLDNPNANCWLADQNNLCKYRVSNVYNASAFDWIGIFKLDFTCDTDVVTWMYVVSSWEDGKNPDKTCSVQNLSFKRQYIPPAGRYLFGYFSRERAGLISVSRPFEILSPKVSSANEVTE